MKEELKIELNKKAEVVEILELYSKFLERHGYTDSDWWCEKPTSVHGFLDQLHFEESSVKKNSDA